MKSLKLLPSEFDFETKAVLKQLSKAHRYLSELNYWNFNI